MYYGNLTGKAVWRRDEYVSYYTSKSVYSGLGLYATASIGNYALFIGGEDDEYDNGGGTAWDTSLTERNVSMDGSHARYPVFSAGTNNGTYALFYGGTDFDRTGGTAYGTTINASLSTSYIMMGGNYVSTAAGTRLGSYGIFTGGHLHESNKAAYSGNAYDTSKTRTALVAMNSNRESHGGASTSSYAIFTGGTYSSGSTSYSSQGTDIYSTSLTHSYNSNAFTGNYVAGASIGAYALFASNFATAVVINNSLTQTSLPNLSASANYCRPAITSINNTAIVHAGHWNNKTCDIYNTSLTKTTNASMSTAKYYDGAASCGSYMLIGTGNGVNKVDVYKLNT